MPRNQQPAGQIGPVLRADYGDRQQAAANAKRVDPVEARKIEHNFREYRAGHPPLQVCLQGDAPHVGRLNTAHPSMLLTKSCTIHHYAPNSINLNLGLKIIQLNC